MLKCCMRTHQDSQRSNPKRPDTTASASAILLQPQKNISVPGQAMLTKRLFSAVVSYHSISAASACTADQASETAPNDATSSTPTRQQHAQCSSHILHPYLQLPCCCRQPLPNLPLNRQLQSHFFKHRTSANLTIPQLCCRELALASPVLALNHVTPRAETP
jgi:hypothetical protein